MATGHRRSQATIFLILGVVMVLAVFLIIATNREYAATNANREISHASETAFAPKPIKGFIEECLALVSKDALRKIGQQSGFLFVSQGSTTPDYEESEEGKFFAFYKGVKASLSDNMPPLKKESGENSIEEQLSSFVGNNIDACLDFSVFENQGFKITEKEKTAEVDVNEDSIIFSLDYPITIEIPESVQIEIEDFSSSYGIRFKKIYEFVKKYIEAGHIPANDFFVDVQKDDSGEYDIIIVSDKESFLDGLPYKYFFARPSNDNSLSSITGAAVSEGNNIPNADAGPNRTVALLADTILFGFGSDADNDAITFRWQLIDKPGGSLATLLNANVQNPSFIPDLEGNYVFRLRINDGKSFSEPSHVTITAKAKDPANTKPTPNPGQGRNINVGQETTLTGFGSDADGDSLVYMWLISNSPSRSIAKLSDPNMQSPGFKPDFAGGYTFKLIVNDGKEDSLPAEVIMTASMPGINRAPSADAGYDKIVKARQEIMLFGTGSDPDNDKLTFSWAILSKPQSSQAILSNDNTPNPTFFPDVNGEYKFSLIVDDGQLDSQPSMVTYQAAEVTENNRPTANAGADRNVNVNEEIELHGTGFDSDNDVLSYRWALANAPQSSGSFLSNPNSNNPRFTPDETGAYTFILAVNDRKEDSVVDKATISASEPGTNRAPSADAGYDKKVKLGQETMLLGNGYDPDNEPLAFTWALASKPPGSQIMLSNISVANPKFTPDIQGSYQFDLKVKDARVTSQSSIVAYTAHTITGNSKPAANAGADRNVNVNEEIELHGTGFDSDNDVLSYRWALANAPQSSGSFLSNPNTNNPGFTPDIEGAYKLALVVNDGKEDSSPDEAIISVVSPGALCIHGDCNVDAKQWCNNGVFVSGGYCDNCGNQDSSCPSCTGNVCDIRNKKWCENSVWRGGSDLEYCSRCGYADSSCPICESNVCDRDNRRWCTNRTWSAIGYCQNCGPLDASCDAACTNGVCDIKNKKICNSGVWEDSNYCLQCGSLDSSCFSECTNNACDTKNKKWCNNGIWKSVDYCTICGNRDFSCASSCNNNICDTTSNKWCNNMAWESLNYCGRCQDSECLGACTNNACDINTKKWCNKGDWTSVGYCAICGSRDSSCAAACIEYTCDTTSNKICSNGVWASINYCNRCALKDSDCTIQCAEGQCDVSNKKVCVNSQWTNSSYCDFCASFDRNCPSSCSVRNDSICNLNCSTGTDPDCLDINVSKPQPAINITCIDDSECASGLCLDGICADPECDDGIQNGQESDIDCGGNCGKCANDKSCNANSDCASNTCFGGVCQEADACKDGILNADETDIDCGGACSNKCDKGKECISDEDCKTSLECVSNLCSEKGAAEAIPDDKKDTDEDGIPDKWELKYGLNPNDMSDANLDFDDDGLTNIREFTLGTNPKSPDSDGDGVSDKEEIEKETDPLDPVSKPGGIGGLLIWSIVIIIIFGAGSYAFYYYKDYFIKPKTTDTGTASYKPILEDKRTVLKKPAEKADIREIMKTRRAEKERKRENIMVGFGKKPEVPEAEKKVIASFGKEKQKEDVFSELKSMSKNKKE